jgi:hypothetical protein
MRRKLVRRLTEARAFQNILGIGGAQYLRLVWATSVITEPPNIYEAIEPHLPLTADVPKIPRVAGEGIVRLAAMSGRPLIAVALASRRRIDLNTWDGGVEPAVQQNCARRRTPKPSTFRYRCGNDRAVPGQAGSRSQCCDQSCLCTRRGFMSDTLPASLALYRLGTRGCFIPQ